MKYFIYGLLAVALVAGCTQAFADPQACKRHSKPGNISPIKTCVLSRPMITLMNVQDQLEPISVTATKYIVIEAAPAACRDLTDYRAPTTLESFFGGWTTTKYPDREQNTECVNDARVRC